MTWFPSSSLGTYVLREFPALIFVTVHSHAQIWLHVAFSTKTLTQPNRLG